jgi:hypothetical protein
MVFTLSSLRVVRIFECPFLNLYSISASHSVFSLPSRSQLPLFPILKTEDCLSEPLQTYVCSQYLSKILELTYMSAFYAIWSSSFITACMDAGKRNLQPQILLLILTHYHLVHSHCQVDVIHCDLATLSILVRMNCFSVIWWFWTISCLCCLLTWSTD